MEKGKQEARNDPLRNWLEMLVSEEGGNKNQITPY